MRWAMWLVSLLVGVPVGAAQPSSAATYGERVREHVLANGLKLILLEDHRAPTAVFQIYYRVGSRDDRPGLTGQAHLLEHMMFKGTGEVGPEEYNRIIQRNGGQTNAFTSRDQTTYFATLASDRLAVVIDLEADRMENLSILESEYEPEKRVVMEERRMRVDDNPVGALFERLNTVAYEAHPYRFPIIGWMEDIRQSTARDLERHYRAYYLPNNAFIVAVGDFEADRLIEEVSRAFGEIEAGAMPPAPRSIEPTQRGPKRVELQREAQLPFVALAHHVPNLRSCDSAALEVLVEVLAGGKSARLHRELVYRQRVARSAGADYSYNSIDAGLLTVYAQPLPGQSTGDVEHALVAEIERLQQQPPSEYELRKAVNQIEAGFVFAQDSLFYQGMLLGDFEAAGDWRHIDAYLPAIRDVKAEDVRRVARFYLVGQNRTVGTLRPSASGGAATEGSR
jgi:zinc protease